jgi:hypothetical protein
MNEVIIMTVKELIDELSKYDEDKHVYIFNGEVTRKMRSLYIDEEGDIVVTYI